jgi:hypothetical protein
MPVAEGERFQLPQESLSVTSPFDSLEIADLTEIPAGSPDTMITLAAQSASTGSNHFDTHVESAELTPTSRCDLQ